MKNYKIAVAGTGYVGLSLSVLLAQHNQVMAVDIVQAKVDMINRCNVVLNKAAMYIQFGIVSLFHRSVWQGRTFLRGADI